MVVVVDEDTEDARVERGTDEANGRSSSDVEPGRCETTDGRRRFAAEAPEGPGQSPSGRLRFELEALRFSTEGVDVAEKGPCRALWAWGSGGEANGQR